MDYNSHSKLDMNHKNICINPYLTEIEWIKYNNYSCRYDSFLTLFIGCLYGYLSIFNNNLNKDILFVIEKSKYLINGNFSVIDEIWKYFIDQKIDILKTVKIDNNLITINDGFHDFGYVNQLFSIFETSDIFCLKYIIEGKCFNCNTILNPNYEYNKCLISINDNFLNLNILDSIFLFLIPEKKKISCNICKLELCSLELTYSIINYPKYLAFIFDYNEYSVLLKLKKEILKKIKSSIISPNNDVYQLIGGITMISHDHFTSFIMNFNYIPNFSEKYETDKIYYHDGIKNKGYFLKFNTFDELFDKYKKLVP